MKNIMPVPINEERPWMVFGACRDADPELFFEYERDNPAPALALCSTCTVTDECLDFALEARLSEGIWGGLTSKARRRLLRETA